jgi:hypothetical protein
MDAADGIVLVGSRHREGACFARREVDAIDHDACMRPVHDRNTVAQNSIAERTAVTDLEDDVAVRTAKRGSSGRAYSNQRSG